jgi:hypothetical protein
MCNGSELQEDIRGWKLGLGIGNSRRGGAVSTRSSSVVIASRPKSIIFHLDDINQRSSRRRERVRVSEREREREMHSREFLNLGEIMEQTIRDLVKKPSSKHYASLDRICDVNLII